MGLFGLFKSKEEKEAIAKKNEINDLFGEDTSNAPKSKKENDKIAKTQQAQANYKEQIEEELRGLAHFVQRHFEDEDCVDNIRNIMSNLREADLGNDVNTSDILARFVKKQVNEAKSHCQAGNQAAVDGMIEHLNTFVNEIGNERKKRYYADSRYMKLKLAAFEHEARMAELETQERDELAKLQRVAAKLKENPKYMTADAFQQKKLEYNRAKQQIEIARNEAKRRLDIVTGDIARLETEISAQHNAMNDQELLKTHGNIMQNVERMEDLSADLDQAADEVNRNNAHVSNANMGMDTVSVSNNKINMDELDDILNM